MSVFLHLSLHALDTGEDEDSVSLGSIANLGATLPGEHEKESTVNRMDASVHEAWGKCIDLILEECDEREESDGRKESDGRASAEQTLASYNYPPRRQEDQDAYRAGQWQT